MNVPCCQTQLSDGAGGSAEADRARPAAGASETNAVTRAADAAKAKAFAVKARQTLNSTTLTDDQKAAALELIEQEMAAWERQVEIREKANARLKNNWPRCFPVLFHNISFDMPTDAIKTMKWMYGVWWFTYWCLFFNLVGMIAGIVEGVIEGGALALAILYFVCGIWIAFFCWYYTVYTAVRVDKASLYFLHFVAFAIHIVGCLIYFIGPLGTGMSGLVIANKAFKEDKKKATAIICVVSAVFWIVNCLLSLVMFRATYKRYRAAGHTFKDVKNEAQKGALKAAV